MGESTDTMNGTRNNNNKENDDPSSSIKTMQLYNDIDRIDNELRELGYDGNTKLDPLVLSKIDSMHYEGDDALQAAVDSMKINRSHSILDIGSGFGGPARFLAQTTQCHVTAIEIQKDIHDKAVQLTNQCQLNDKVTHVVGDILNNEPNNNILSSNKALFFDGIVSWLVFLHIEDKRSLFSKCAQLLQPKTGRLFIDDFFQISEFTPEEETSLRTDVYVAKLQTREEYLATLEEVGFTNIQFEDRTQEWKSFVKDRLNNFIANRSRFERVNSPPTYQKLLHFYSAIVALFHGGHLGGVRLTAEFKK